jgi:hypothetical protein
MKKHNLTLEELEETLMDEAPPVDKTVNMEIAEIA